MDLIKGDLKQAKLWETVVKEHCFAAGTPVLTPTGEKPIEEFQPGDEILSRPEDSPQAPVRTSTVEKVFRLSGPTLELRVGGRVVVTTEKHPFYVQGRGWVWAAELKPGDLLLGHQGEPRAVESVALTGRVETLYNLRVAFDRTYFVGSPSWGFSLWVHNTYILRTNASGLREIGALDEAGYFVPKASVRPGTSAADAERLVALMNRLGDRRRIALGIDSHLDDFSRLVDAESWKEFAKADPMNWKTIFMELMHDSEVEVVFNLTGVDVWGGLSRASRGAGGATDWELLQIWEHREWWPRIKWYNNGRPVHNPFL